MIQTFVPYIHHVNGSLSMSDMPKAPHDLMINITEVAKQVLKLKRGKTGGLLSKFGGSLVGT